MISISWKAMLSCDSWARTLRRQVCPEDEQMDQRDFVHSAKIWRRFSANLLRRKFEMNEPFASTKRIFK